MKTMTTTTSTSTTGSSCTSTSAITTCHFSTSRGRTMSSNSRLSASNRPNGENGRDDAATGRGSTVGPRRRVGRRGGNGGPTSGDDGVGDDENMLRSRRRRRRPTEGSINNYSSGPYSMNGRSMNAQRSSSDSDSGSGSNSRVVGGGSSFPRGGNRNIGADYDYSGGNLRFGTGKYQQRVNDGYSGGVNLSSSGRSMQHDIYNSGRRDGRQRRYYDDRFNGPYNGDDDLMLFPENDYYDNEDDGYNYRMLEDYDRMMMYDDDEMDMMMGDHEYYDDLYYRRTPGGGGGGGVFRDDYYQWSGRGGPRTYSNSHNGGYTTNGRSHQYNSRMDELRRYQDGFYYGDDSYFAQRGGYGDLPPPRHRGRFGGGGRAGLLRDMLD
jgi:hypothetical protein